MKALKTFFFALCFAAPAYAIEPETREVIVTHNRVWDGFAYQENFVPSDLDEIWLLPEKDNAVSFVRTLEYYWPLARQKYVAFERQREELEGELRISQEGAIIESVDVAPYVIVYPKGVVNGNGTLVWGDEALAAYKGYLDEERELVRKFSEIKRLHSKYERDLLDSGAARLAGEEVVEVTPPPPLPETSLKLVTEPRRSYRVSLPIGEYDAAIFIDGEEILGSQERINVFDAQQTQVSIAEIIPEERWTRPFRSETANDRIYAKPGTPFFVTLAKADVYKESDYTRLTRPQDPFSEGRLSYISRGPDEQMEASVSWAKADLANLVREPLKVDQTRGSDFGYVVRGAEEGEKPDIQAFVIEVPSAGTSRGTFETASGFEREIIVVLERNSLWTWGLALLPALFGLMQYMRRRVKPA